MDFPGGLVVMNLSVNVGDVGLIPGQEDPLENEMTTHSSVLDWKSPWTENPRGLWSMGSEIIGHDLETELQNALI